MGPQIGTLDAASSACCKLSCVGLTECTEVWR